MFCKLKKWALNLPESNKYLIVALTICELFIPVHFRLPKGSKLTKHSLVVLKVLSIISAILFKRVKQMFV